MIKPFGHNMTNEIHKSLANKISNDVINRITETLKNIDASELFFSVNIQTNESD